MAISDADHSHNTAGSSAEWLGNYITDVWNKPQDHLVEIGIAGVAAAAAVSAIEHS